VAWSRNSQPVSEQCFIKTWQMNALATALFDETILIVDKRSYETSI